MSSQEFLEKLQKAKLRIKEDDTPLRLASYSAIALQSVRIFTNGLGSNNSKIGNYSTKDIWINPQPKSGDFIPRNSNGFSPLKGKNGNTVFKTNPERKRKTSFFEGWKGFREVQGLQGNTVDLNYTGELFLDFCNPQGGRPTTRKITNTEYVTSLKRPLSHKKLRGAEERFNTVIGNLTEDEKQAFYSTVGFELRKLIAA